MIPVYYPTKELDLIYSLGVCGCGCPEITYNAIQKMLERAEKGESLIIGSDEMKPYVYFMAYTLDSAGFLTHGGSIDCAWLKEKGKLVLEALREYEKYGYEHDRILDNPYFFERKDGADNDL